MSDTETPAHFEVYESADESWRWRFVGEDGITFADSSGSYPSQEKALEGLRFVQANASSATVTLPTDPTDPVDPADAADD